MPTPKLYKHVLVAIDLTKQSDALLKYATTVAKLFKAKLSLIHVLSHTPIAYGGEFSIPVDIDLEQSIKKQASAELAKLGKKYGVAVKSQYVENGSIQMAINQVAQKIKADLIVVGTHSHRGLERLL